MNEDKKILAVRNERQKLLFEQELLGQISDGFWENAQPENHYNDFDDVHVIVDEYEDVGVNFDIRKNYKFHDEDLVGIIGDRMLFMVRSLLRRGVYDKNIPFMLTLSNKDYAHPIDTFQKLAKEDNHYLARLYDTLTNYNIKQIDIRELYDDIQRTPYHEHDLINDLKDLSKIIKIRR